MNARSDKDVKPSPEQIVYANVLSAGAWMGILLLLVTYLLYVTGVVSPHVELSQIPQLWGKGVDEYLKITHSPQGWGWLFMLGKGDYLNYLGLALLALMTIVCYLVLLPGYIQRRDWTYSIVCILEILVLSVAASGVLGSGGH